MEKHSHTSIHWAIGVVFLLTGIVILSALSVSQSEAQGNINGPLNLNLNVNNLPPVINGFQLFHDNGGITSISVGDTVPGIVGGNVNIIMNVNITDQNSFDAHPGFASRYRLARTHSGTNYFVNTEGGTNDDVLYSASSYDTTKLPKNSAGGCTVISYYNAGFGVNTGALVRCEMPIYFISDPTTAGSSTNSTTDFSADRWQIAFEADDQMSKTRDFQNMYFEYPNILGLTVDPQINLGQVTTDGTASALANTNVTNKGNQQLDIALEVNKQTDGDAWTCAGSDEPLVSDIHHAAAGGTTVYSSMTALILNAAGSGTLESTFDLERSVLLSGPSLKTEGFKFATTRPVGAGVCTLSAIVVTALKGY